MTDAGHSFAAYFKRATSPLVVLTLLKEKTMYGYEISAEIKTRSDGRLSIAVLYPVLYKLQEQGYVMISNTEIIDGRARNYYQITEAGLAHLEKTLSEYKTMSATFCKFTGIDG